MLDAYSNKLNRCRYVELTKKLNLVLDLDFKTVKRIHFKFL